MFTIKKLSSFKYLKLFRDGHPTHHNSSSQGSGNTAEEGGIKLIKIQKSGKTVKKQCRLHMTGNDTQFFTTIIAYTIRKFCMQTVSSLFQHSWWRSSLKLVDKLRTVENCQGTESQFSSEIGFLVCYPHTVDSPTVMEIWTTS